MQTREAPSSGQRDPKRSVGPIRYLIAWLQGDASIIGHAKVRDSSEEDTQYSDRVHTHV